MAHYGSTKRVPGPKRSIVPPKGARMPMGEPPAMTAGGEAPTPKKRGRRRGR